MNWFFLCLYFSVCLHFWHLYLFKSDAKIQKSRGFDQRTRIIHFECTWGEWVWLWCCVWAVVCQLRLVWFLCKNILSRSVCQEARWTHRPMRSSDDPVWPIRGQRELCLRCGEMFGLNLALFEFLRLYPRFYQVLSSTCDISWHLKSVSFAHLSMTHLFSTEYDQENYHDGQQNATDDAECYQQTIFCLLIHYKFIGLDLSEMFRNSFKMKQMKLREQTALHSREIDCFILEFCRKSTFYHNQSQVFPNCTSKSQSIFIFCHFLRPRPINHWIWEHQRTKMNFIYNTATARNQLWPWLLL